MLLVLTGPPLPGRWSLARALERRCAARRFVADAASAPLFEISRALGRGDVCVLVDGDLATTASRESVLAVAGATGDRLLVEWRCGRQEAEREAFHRYASRPQTLASAELGKYLEDARVREELTARDDDVTVVRVGPELPLDAQVERVIRALRVPPLPLPPEPDDDDDGRDVRRRVMVVEDDAEERALLADVLRELGFDVELAPDAGVALALLDEGVEVELLLSDQQMPGMSGVELAREVARRHGLRTVLLTGFSDEDTCRKALDARAVTVLAKPLSLIDLERALEEAGG